MHRVTGFVTTVSSQPPFGPQPVSHRESSPDALPDLFPAHVDLPGRLDSKTHLTPPDARDRDRHVRPDMTGLPLAAPGSAWLLLALCYRSGPPSPVRGLRRVATRQAPYDTKRAGGDAGRRRGEIRASASRGARQVAAHRHPVVRSPAAASRPVQVNRAHHHRGAPGVRRRFEQAGQLLAEVDTLMIHSPVMSPFSGCSR